MKRGLLSSQGCVTLQDSGADKTGGTKYLLATLHREKNDGSGEKSEYRFGCWVLRSFHRPPEVACVSNKTRMVFRSGVVFKVAKSQEFMIVLVVWSRGEKHQ